MEYILNIYRKENNPNYSPKSQPYGREEQSEYLINELALTVILKEEEFIAIKKAVIEVIK